MAGAGPSFTVGLEEEYLLVDPDTRDLAPIRRARSCCALRGGLDPAAGTVTPELLRAADRGRHAGLRNRSAEARERPRRLRRCVASVAEAHGLALIAASTHPFADWHVQRHTDKERYNVLAATADRRPAPADLRHARARRHRGRRAQRIDLMNQLPAISCRISWR